MISEGASDSPQDLTYTAIDKNQKNNVLLFDVIHGEIQAIHLERKGFDMSDCDEYLSETNAGKTSFLWI
ncbi:hypothetical protein [Acinetobacter bouvetii]|uniref:Uncharacterized protein n=1 Tax=Acinetobacter bouvetii TaxID=202951 RepID=A0A811GCF8_9GAMM|nr:hypothetical protein [Acinetobacter bouvetii]CAB1220106.1 hypothetical protein SFB21_2521 [Acinetobacter bouvetii]